MQPAHCFVYVCSVDAQPVPSLDVKVLLAAGIAGVPRPLVRGGFTIRCCGVRGLWFADREGLSAHQVQRT